MLNPVPKRTCNGDYELFYMAFDRVNEVPFAPLNINPAPLLCVFSPARAGASKAASAWEMRRNVRWSVPVSVEERFRTDLTFFFQGKGFWVDLSQGLRYCDLDGTAVAGDHSVVDFSYIELPPECVLELERALRLHLQEPMEATRTMGCDSDSIWFVCIDESTSDDCADNLVSMWTLKLHGGAAGAVEERGQVFSQRSLEVRRLQGGRSSGGAGGVPSPRCGGWCPLPRAVWRVLGTRC